VTLSLLVLLLAGVAGIAFAVSLLVGLLLGALDRRVERLAPRARARLLLVLALLPGSMATVLMTTALAPSFGLLADHCAPPLDPHSHAHLCIAHQARTLPAPALLALSLSLAAALISRGALIGRDLCRAWRTRRRLEAIAQRAGNLRVLPLSNAGAFVLGVWRPALFVTRGLLDAPEHAAAVLAHERAHLRSADTLRRLIARLGLAFHLPGVAGMIERRLGCSLELCADEAAAKVVGSGEQVARAVVYMARARQQAPAPALAFGAADLEARVRHLLDPHAGRDAPRLRTLGLVLVGALALIGASADGIHHAIEHLLALLG
jgi:Zn-dependent protease with chaperone function